MTEKPEIPRDVLKLWRAFDRYGVYITCNGYADEPSVVEMYVDSVTWAISGYSQQWRIEAEVGRGLIKTYSYSDAEIRAAYAKNPVSLELKRG